MLKCDLPLVSNADEMLVFLNMITNKSFGKGSSKLVNLRISGYEEKHVTVFLTLGTCGNILPPMIIFPGKTNRTIKDLTNPDNLCIVTLEKA